METSNNHCEKTLLPTTTIMPLPLPSCCHLRGSHLYLMLDDIVETGPDDLVRYLQSLAVPVVHPKSVKNDTKKGTFESTTSIPSNMDTPPSLVVESAFVKGAMSRDTNRIPEESALVVFQALGGITTLARLEVSGDGRFGGLYLPARAMTAALSKQQQQQQQQQHKKSQHQNCLQSLRLGNVILTSHNRRHTTSGMNTNSNQSMEDLAAALQELPHLTSIDLVRCRAEFHTGHGDHNNNSAVSLEPLVQAVASMPTIQQAMFCETIISSSNNRTGNYLAVLCQAPSLQKLWWKTMPGMNDAHITSMVEQLLLHNNNTKLTELTIRSHGLGAQAGQAIANLLVHNTTLQVINLDLDRAEYGLAIAPALLRNTSLKCLDVWAWGGDISLQHSRAITKVFTRMLRSNRVLKFLTFQGLDWTNPEIDFYLRLNRAGREYLLEHFDQKSHWTRALVKHKDDVDVCFYFLSLNPNIIPASHSSLSASSSQETSSDGTIKLKRERGETSIRALPLVQKRTKV